MFPDFVKVLVVVNRLFTEAIDILTSNQIIPLSKIDSEM